ncbi:hypothetical protein GCM10009679_54600 [Saccharothrix algeriensis]|uniref:Uncharacterized protein n=1 Tax=Catellatospora bangladeshensis TaxID=310355 RepID=A0A8J3JQJ2_9ACTN|nr:hypothetical protein Cba03nite_64510 [Catellatospora bangladeshensis]
MVATPSRAARASPSDSGSIPTIATIRSDSLNRNTLIIRSVPMFPDPITATPAFTGCLPCRLLAPHRVLLR